MMYMRCIHGITRRQFHLVPHRRVMFPFLGFKSNDKDIELGTNISNTMREFDNDITQYVFKKKSWGRDSDDKGAEKTTNEQKQQKQQQQQQQQQQQPSNTNNDNTQMKRNPLADGISLLAPEELIKMDSFFNSYKVYKEFKKIGFNEDQSLALMRYTYVVLENKLKWLHTNYSPKVDLENEAYLFQAAHSELLFETTNTREISLMDMTNAMIILKRAFNSLEDESSAQIKLNDDIIKMEINQFKHENNLHQRLLNLKNSDLNSRILSEIVSGLKSEIESFRWELTRAGILCIMLMTVCIMGTWNLTKKPAAEEGELTKGPLLMPLHEATDEESHDYEADWDDRVNVQVKR